MRNLLKSLAVVAAVVPAMALGAITGSKHDLTFSGNTVYTTGTTQICIFCHTPHRARQQTLIWNQAQSGVTGFASGTFTTAGTTLGTLTSTSRACLGCHDGTTAIGNVANGGGGAAIQFTMAGTTGNVMPAGYVVDLTQPATMGNHPISVPYPGATYNGTTSAIASATGAVGGYYAVATTGCATTNPTGVCTSNNTAIVLFPAGGVKSATTVGVECGSCHDTHNSIAANSYFLRVSANGSAVCLACHNK